MNAAVSYKFEGRGSAAAQFLGTFISTLLHYLPAVHYKTTEQP